jgi:hypothetical protein
MIETILNLVWLAVTLAALWLWRFRWAATPRNSRHEIRVEAVAIICVLALLFPVISLTDDLHPEVVPVDSISSKRNHSLLLASGHHAAHSGSQLSAHSAFALLSHPALETIRPYAGFVPGMRVPRAAGRSRAASGRSPPSLA